ncbi:MAG: hypothetical protein KKE20_02550 [Nanoarchaeota archaeon]|nr:hypothetical protein [Nanoarchaeota archaeon]
MGERFFIWAFAFIAVIMMAGCKEGITGMTGLDAGKEEGDGSDNSLEVVSVETIKTDTTSLKVTCYQDSDCGDSLSEKPKCFQGNVVTEIHTPKCTYPGTINSFCHIEREDKIELCNGPKDDCSDGRCVIISQEPCMDTDGGKNYAKAGIVNDGFLKTYEDLCQDERWLIEMYCSHGTKGYGMQEFRRCDKGCRDGACVS